MQKAQNNNIFLNNKIIPLIRDFKAKKLAAALMTMQGILT